MYIKLKHICEEAFGEKGRIPMDTKAAVAFKAGQPLSIETCTT